MVCVIWGMWYVLSWVRGMCYTGYMVCVIRGMWYVLCGVCGICYMRYDGMCYAV